MSLLVAIDGSGNIEPGSLGHFVRSELEILFPNPLTVVDVRGLIPAVDGVISDDFTIQENSDDPQDIFNELVLKPVTDRFHLEIIGSSTITVNGNTNYTIKKSDFDNVDILSGSETVDIKVTRGLLSVLSISLVSGQATFNLTAPNETVDCDISVNIANKFFGNKSIKFVL